MRLSVLILESRESPVALDWLFDPDPWLQARANTIRQAGDVLAAVVTRPDVPTLRVRVEPDPQPGAVADGTPYTWADGPRIRLDTEYPYWDRLSLAAVVQHELMHVFGVPDHSDEPDSLLSVPPPLQPLDKPSPGDVAALQAVGWTVTLPPDPPEEVYPYTEEHPYVGPLVRVSIPGGWAHVPPRVAEQWGLT